MQSYFSCNIEFVHPFELPSCPFASVGVAALYHRLVRPFPRKTKMKFKFEHELSRSNSLEKSWCYIPGIDRVVKTWWRAKEINQRFPRNQICSKACGGWDNERVTIQFLSAILDFFTVKHEVNGLILIQFKLIAPFLKRRTRFLHSLPLLHHLSYFTLFPPYHMRHKYSF